MYYISSIYYPNSNDDECCLDYLFLNSMIESKVLKSFFSVYHCDVSSPHCHLYFEFYSKKVFYENYALFSSLGFTSFYKASFYKWFTYLYYDTPIFSADIFGTKYKNIMSKILDR